MNVVGRGGLAWPICGKHEFNVTNKGSMVQIMPQKHLRIRSKSGN